MDVTQTDDTMLVQELDSTKYDRMVNSYLENNNTNTPSASFLEDIDFQPSDIEAGITQEEIHCSGDGILKKLYQKLTW